MTQAAAGRDFCRQAGRLGMSCQPANAHEAQVSPPNFSTHRSISIPFHDLMYSMLTFLVLFLLRREDLPVVTSAPTQVTFSLRSLPASSSSPSFDSPGSSKITPWKIEDFSVNLWKQYHHPDEKQCVAHLAYLYRVALWEQMRPGINNLLTSSLQPHNAPSGLWQQDLQQNNTSFARWRWKHPLILEILLLLGENHYTEYTQSIHYFTNSIAPNITLIPSHCTVRWEPALSPASNFLSLLPVTKLLMDMAWYLWHFREPPDLKEILV